MRKKILIMSMFCLAAMTIKAEPVHQYEDSIIHQKTFSQEPMLLSGNPTYLKNVSEAANWGRNWFIEVKGGASAFLGSPIGCGDVFDRVKPALQVGLGKWFTPAIGGRIGFQGLSFKNAEFKSMKYQFIHADFMYNLTSGIRCNESGIPLWDVIPYLGVGMIHNSDWSGSCTCSGGSSGSHPFAFSYGIEARYRLNDRLHLVAGISGMTTAKNFDDIGTSTKFGDHMLTVSAGLSFTIGKTGWKRVIDARPYIVQNEWLSAYAASLSDSNSRYHAQHDRDRQTMEQLRKILAIEGLLDKYGHLFPDDATSSVTNGYPRNDYSGLNSLRARMRDKYGNGQKAKVVESASCAEECGNDTGENEDNYLSLIHSGKACIGAPIYFFFELGTDRLLNKSQLVNLDEVARIAKKYGLKVKVIGAADSATGSEAINDNLSRSRARFIAEELMKRGMESGTISQIFDGGIDDYSPNEANRHTRILLYL